MTLVMHDGLEVSDSSDQADGAERRRGLRILQSRPIKVLDTLGGKYFGGQTQDISSTGLRIELPAHYVGAHGAAAQHSRGIERARKFAGESAADDPGESGMGQPGKRSEKDDHRGGGICGLYQRPA